MQLYRWKYYWNWNFATWLGCGIWWLILEFSVLKRVLGNFVWTLNINNEFRSIFISTFTESKWIQKQKYLLLNTRNVNTSLNLYCIRLLNHRTLMNVIELKIQRPNFQKRHTPLCLETSTAFYSGWIGKVFILTYGWDICINQRPSLYIFKIE